MEYDYQTLIELKKILETKIEEYNYLIENFSVKGSDEEFEKLLKNYLFQKYIAKNQF